MNSMTLKGSGDGFNALVGVGFWRFVCKSLEMSAVVSLQILDYVFDAFNASEQE